MTDREKAAVATNNHTAKKENETKYNKKPFEEKALEISKKWPVFPVKSRNKTPLTKNGFHDATQDQGTIDGWVELYPDANIGVPTGNKSGFFVLDVDGEEGKKNISALEQKYGTLPKTVKVETGGDGVHYYFKMPLDKEISNSAGKIAPCVDVRGTGGYIIVPPSIHKCGKGYEKSHDSAFIIDEAPDWLIEAIVTVPMTLDKNTENEKIIEGKRNENLTSIAGGYFQKDLSHEEVLKLCLDTNQSRCVPPLSEKEVNAIVDSIAKCDAKNLTILPLIPPLPECPKVPKDVLGDILSNAVEAIHDISQAPEAICFQSVLAAATLVTQGHGDISIAGGGTRPVSGSFITLAESGERKTTVDKLATSALKDFEAELSADFEQNFRDFSNDCEAWEQARSDAKKKGKGDRQAIKKALDQIGCKPIQPLYPQLTLNDVTIEGLHKALPEGQPSQGLFTSEGGQFFGGYSMGKDNRLKTSTAMSSLWDGEPLKIVRKGDDLRGYAGKRLSTHLMLQPSIALEQLNDEMLMGQGFWSRQLVVAPESTAGKRVIKKPEQKSADALKTYNNRMLEILRTPYDYKSGENFVLEPKTMELSPAAEGIWESFYNAVESNIGKYGEYSTIKSFASKAAEHAARIAAVLSLFEDLDTNIIAEDKMKSGIIIAQFYIDQWLRLIKVIKTDPDYRKAQAVWDWIQTKWTEEYISAPDIYQNGVSSLTSPKMCQPILKILEDHCYLKPAGRQKVDGKMRRVTWRINGSSK